MDTSVKVFRYENPREHANIFSQLIFFYMVPLFHWNYKNTLKEEDLFLPLLEHESSYLGNQIEDVWRGYQEKHKRSALHRALFKLFGVQFVTVGICKLMSDLILVTIMPRSVGKLVAYFGTDSPLTKNDALICACFIILCLLIEAFISHPVILAMMHLGMKMRIACSSLIYRKSLRLNKSSLAETTVGQIVNLLSNDVSKFDHNFIIIHSAWTAPLQTAVATYMLYREIGDFAFVGIGFLLLFVPLQLYIGKKTSVLRLRTALRTDERVGLMNEIISGIQVIKMYAWEKPFAQLVAAARRFEMKAVSFHSYLAMLGLCFEMFLTRTCIFLSFMTFVYSGHDITAQKVFLVTAIYNVINANITTLFVFAISSAAEVNISINRLQKFLSYDELDHLQYEFPHVEANETLEAMSNDISAHNQNAKIVMKNVYAKWLSDSTDNTLTDVSLSINSHALVTIIGAVGSGKSSLFNVLLKELPIQSGAMEICGTISYSSQEPWLFSASAKQNIIFGDEYDEDRYRDVVRVCALGPDFAMLPCGDNTLVGEKGKSLSGGQKARVNLARCIYKKADIYLLDDPLSAVDANVGQHLYEQCISTFLKDRICILITHQLQYLSNADKIVIFKDGVIDGQGTYNELQDSGLDFAILLKQFHSKDVPTEEKKLLKARQNSVKPDEDEDIEQEDLRELAGSGHNKTNLYLEYCKTGGNYCLIGFVAILVIIAQVAGNAVDYFVSYWVNLEQELTEKKANHMTLNNNNEVPRDTILYTYSGITAATVVLHLTHSTIFIWFCIRISVKLHDKIFERISFAVMNFFNANPVGRILNRFSSDMGIIDEYIPFYMFAVIWVLLPICGTITLTAIVNPWLLLPLSVLLLLLYPMRCVYLRMSKNVKRIEAATRSPILNHLHATMQGLATIRAFSAEAILVKEFDSHLNLHSSAWYMYIVSSRAFAMWINLLSIAFISGIIMSVLFFGNDYLGGDVGLIITQCIATISVLQWGMFEWAELENYMTHFERVLEYTRLETEPERLLHASLPKNWPENGEIEFKSVFMKYKQDDPYVLKDITFKIQPKEKLGIVGRTGAGKSSIISALFQLYHTEGSIIIDTVGVTEIPLETLRSKLSIIPQEPFLFSGTMRKNLDPFDEYDDETLWKALEQVELRDAMAEMPSGLNSNVSEGGSNFSVGQRQLVCLARAILRNNKILVMDEATANVDPHTDALIQKTIRQKFLECTVITIAHRLHTIMDSDRVLVMNRGIVAEFDHPHLLLQDRNGVFFNMVETTGTTTAANLRTMAQERFAGAKSSN